MKKPNNPKPVEVPYINYRKYLLFLIPIAFIDLLILLISNIFIGFCEEYAATVYKTVSSVISFFTNALPHIVWANLLLYIGLAIFCFSLVRILVYFFRYRKTAYRFRISYRIKKTGMNYALIFLILIFFYVGGKGILYHRINFFAANYLSEDLTKLSSYTTEELSDMAKTTLQELTESEEEALNSLANTSREDLSSLATTAYQSLRNDYPGLYPLTLKPKQDYVFGVTGLYGQACVSTSLTFEAVVSANLPEALKPYAMAKSLAGISGYCRDDERNYIAYQLCMSSQNKAYQYSARLVALYAIQNELSIRKEVKILTELSLLQSPQLQLYLQQLSEMHGV